MKRKKYVDVDALSAGDNLDRAVACNLYGGVFTTQQWFIADKRRKKPYYVGPRFSKEISDAMVALNFYITRYPLDTNKEIKSWCLVEQTEKGPYACVAEVRYPEQMTVRAWGPTMPVAISRMLAKVPTK